jgi:glyoxylase-like metal-dependent hydrolase (beta-lactamase superfamily II)
VVILLLATGLQAQQDQSKITVVPVAGPLYLLQEGGAGNVGVVADPAGVFMVDAMVEADAGAIREAIKSLAGGDHVRILVNTHWHFDHTGGNNALGSGAVIISHENVRARLATDQTLFGRVSKALPASALPSVTFPTELTVYAGGQAIRLRHYPHAHTDGDTVVFYDSLKVVQMGDMFFNGMFPFMDVDHGGDIEIWIRQLDGILAGLAADTKVIPGHGPLAGVAELKAFRQMLFDSAGLVRDQMKVGKTLDQIKAAGLTEGLKPWAKGFMTADQWLELVYRSLDKAAKK